VFDVEYIYYCGAKFFYFRLDFACIRGVVHSPKYRSKTCFPWAGTYETVCFSAKAFIIVVYFSADLG
jgi:hypothetical protein